MLRLLWSSIEERLDDGLPDWRGRIDDLGQVASVKKRETGTQWGNNQVFESLVRSVLSANTDWSKVERVLPELSALFHGFSLSWYAALPLSEVNEALVPWFKERRANSQSLRKNLERLVETANQLSHLSKDHGSLENYLAHLSVQQNGDIKAVAASLGEHQSPAKLPGLGVALAAEFLKNVGHDVSKPDRHINRAAGSFGLVQFANWHDRNGTRPPAAGKYELRTVMRVMELWAQELGFRAAFLDNAVWLLCAKKPSGLYLSNHDLGALRPHN
jgi:endonuclease III